jgi:hypothetical protein
VLLTAATEAVAAAAAIGSNIEAAAPAAVIHAAGHQVAGISAERVAHVRAIASAAGFNSTTGNQPE